MWAEGAGVERASGQSECRGMCARACVHVRVCMCVNVSLVNTGENSKYVAVILSPPTKDNSKAFIGVCNRTFSRGHCTLSTFSPPCL